MSIADLTTIKLMPGLRMSDELNQTNSQSTPIQAVLQTLNLLGLEYSVHSFKEGENLYLENEETKGIYLLKSGCVKLCIHRNSHRGRTTTPEYVTKLVSKDEVFGYKEVIQNTERKSFAVAVKDSVVWLYSKESMLSVLKQTHPLIRAVLEQSVQEISSFEQINQFHYLASVQERIAYQLVKLSEKFGVPTVKGVSLNLKLTRNEFAQLASTINESLSRHLTEFKNEGLIDINGKEIIIINKQGLLLKANVN